MWNEKNDALYCEQNNYIQENFERMRMGEDEERERGIFTGRAGLG